MASPDDLIAIVLGLLGGRRYWLLRLGRGTFARAALGGVGALGCCGRGRRTDLSGPGGRRLLTGNRYE
jgi:hypothetical protein